MDHFWIEAIGYAGTAFTILSCAMRTIIPLRVAGILSSVFLIIYAVFLDSWPVLITELVILPLNVLRLVQILRLMREVEEAHGSDLALHWLRPFAMDRDHQRGDVLFRAGEPAQYLLVIQSGRFLLRESGIELSAGQLVGEMGFLSPGNLRTMTLECIAAGRVGRISYADVKQIYFQNPKFGFFFLRLISERLFQNLQRMEAAVRAVADVAPAATQTKLVQFGGHGQEADDEPRTGPALN